MMKKRIFRKITVIALAAAMLVISLCGTSFAWSGGRWPSIASPAVSVSKDASGNVTINMSASWTVETSSGAPNFGFALASARSSAPPYSFYESHTDSYGDSRTIHYSHYYTNAYLYRSGGTDYYLANMTNYRTGSKNVYDGTAADQYFGSIRGNNSSSYSQSSTVSYTGNLSLGKSPYISVPINMQLYKYRVVTNDGDCTDTVRYSYSASATVTISASQTETVYNKLMADYGHCRVDVMTTASLEGDPCCTCECKFITYINDWDNRKVIDLAPYISPTVTLNQNGGSGGTTQIIPTVGAAMPAITKPTRAGYRFDGYYAAVNTGTSVSTAPGASYGFNSSGGYYVSSNGGVDSSAAVARVTFTVLNDTAVTIQVINSGESGYDYGIIGNVDQALNTSSTSDNTYWWKPSNSTSAQTNTITIPAGTHFIDFKYRKDSSMSRGNDSLQFKINTSIPSSSQNIFFYDANGNSAHTWFKCGSTLTAAWTLMQYTVTLDQQGGSGGSGSVTATNGSAMPSATMPSKTGYDFGGYFTSTGGGGTKYYNANGTSARNYDKSSGITLYAYWTAKQSTVTFDRQSGTGGTASTTATYAAAMPKITPPTRSGCSFNGYYTAKNGGGTKYYNADGTSAKTCDLTSNTTLYAYWLAYVDLNGSINGTSQSNTSPAATVDVYINGSRVSAGCTDFYSQYVPGTTWEFKNIKVNSGYALNGNTSYSGTVSGNTGASIPFVTCYTVSYDGNGSTSGSTAQSSHKYSIASALTANGFAKTGYAFSQWNTKADGTGTGYADKASVTNLSSAANGTVTLYARWTPNVYSIEFNGNGHTGGSTASISATYDKSYALTANGFAKTGYLFNGWNTAANGSGMSYADGETVKNLSPTHGSSVILYAQWRPITYTVSFEKNDEDHVYNEAKGSMDLITVRYDEQVNLPVNVFTYTGYTFTGWHRNKAAAAPEFGNQAVIKNLTTTDGQNIPFYAIWKENVYVIRYELGGGHWADGFEPVTSRVYTELVKMPRADQVERDGYEFAGWYSDPAFTQPLENAFITASDTTMYVKWLPYSGTTGSCTWRFDKDSGTFTISGAGGVTGSVTDTTLREYDWLADQVTKIVIEEGVAELGQNVFTGFVNVNNIVNKSGDIRRTFGTSFTGVGSEADKVDVETCVNNAFFESMIGLPSVENDAVIVITTTANVSLVSYLQGDM